MNQKTILAKYQHHKKQAQHYENMLLMHDIKTIKTKPTPSEKQIVENICKKGGILPEELYSGSRLREIIRVKKQIAKTLHNNGITLQRIAFILGMKHHASIIYYLKS